MDPSGPQPPEPPFNPPTTPLPPVASPPSAPPPAGPPPVPPPPVPATVPTVPPPLEPITTPPPSTRMPDVGSGARRALSSLILFFAAMALVGGVAGLWIRGTLLDPEGFSKLAAGLLATPGVQASLGNSITSAITDGTPALEAHRAQVEEAVDTAVSNPEFIAVFQGALAEGYRSLLDGNGGFALNLSPSMEQIRTQLAAVDPKLAAQLPGPKRLEEIGSFAQDAVPENVSSALQTARTALLWTLIVGILLVAVGLVVADRRWRALRVLGIQVAITAGLLLGGILLAGGAVGSLSGISELENSIGDAWGTIMGGLVRNLAILTGLGVLAVIAGIFGERAMRNRV